MVNNKILKSTFFILSFSRSGSTVLGQKLNNHSKVKVINESWFFTLLAKFRWKTLNITKQKYILHQLFKNNSKLKEKVVFRGSSEHISPNALFTHTYNTKASFIGEKTPSNTFIYNYIRTLYPESKFIFLKRHPLAITSSYFSRWYSENYDDKFIINSVATIRAYFNAYNKINKNEILEISYENLVEYPEKTLSKLSDYIGFDFEEKMLYKSEKIFEFSADEKYHLHAHQPLIKSRTYRFKSTFNSHQLIELSYLLRNEIISLGYEQEILIKPTKRLQNLDKKINKIISPNQIMTRRFISLVKGNLSYNLFRIKRIFLGYKLL
ncbi:MAG: sulfotransferase family protein [Flavobacteriales bacterium]